MHGKYILLLALIYTAVIQDGKAAKLTITPSQNLQAGATSLTLLCSSDYNSTFTKIHTMEMYKQIMGSQRMLIANIDSTGKFMTGIGIVVPKYIVVSTFNPLLTQQSYNRIQFDIYNPDCHDAAEYTCEITGETTTSSNPVYLKDSKNVTVQSNPGTVEMKIFPEKLKYEVGEEIEITCQTGVETPEFTWAWESKSRSDIVFTEKIGKIMESPVDPETSTQCGYNTGSTLYHRVDMDDDGLKIRCIVDNSELNSAITTIYLTLDEVKKRMLLADTERVKLEQENLKQQISKNTTNCCCH